MTRGQRIAVAASTCVAALVLAVGVVRSVQEPPRDILPAIDRSVAVTGMSFELDATGTCCWLQDAATFGVAIPRGAASIWLAFYVAQGVVPEGAKIWIDDGRPVRVQDIPAGVYFVDVPLGKPRPAAGTARIRIELDRTFPDGRSVILTALGTDIYGG